MSVHREGTSDGTAVYRVRWRQGGRGTVQSSRTFDLEDDARDFDRRVRRLKQTGDPALLADEITVRDTSSASGGPTTPSAASPCPRRRATRSTLTCASSHGSETSASRSFAPASSSGSRPTLSARAPDGPRSSARWPSYRAS